MIKYFRSDNGRQAEAFVGLRRSIPSSVLLLCLVFAAEGVVGQTAW